MEKKGVSFKAENTLSEIVEREDLDLADKLYFFISDSLCKLSLVKAAPPYSYFFTTKVFAMMS